MSFRHDDELTLMDWFCGAGGSSQGADAVPGVRVELAANHWQLALDSHASNFPNVRHERGDIRELPVHTWPVAMGFWASPECKKWTNARGVAVDYDRADDALPGLEKPAPPEEDERSRALMWDIPKYLDGVQRRGKLVLFGVVENVVQARKGAHWDRWWRDIERLGYRLRLIALNSMHVQPRTLDRAPQSRDRLYVAYWHRSIGRNPDFDKWLRPTAYCPGCDALVQAMQVFKNPRNDMGRYGIRHGQYVYRCPRTSCRNHVVEPEVLPAAVAVDWSIPGTPIGERKPTKKAPDGLTPKTLARIRAGLAKYARPLTADADESEHQEARAVPPMLVPSGGTWRQAALSVAEPMATRTTSENDALAVPPLLVPSEGRDGKEATPASRPMRAQTTRRETGLAWLPGDFPPFITPVRGGGDAEKARPITHPLHAVTAGGNHHGLVMDPQMGAMLVRNNTPRGAAGHLCTPLDEAMRTLTAAGHQSLATWDQQLLVPYYGNGNARPVDQPVGALTTRDRYALVQAAEQIDLASVLYRMLEPHEIARGMSFGKKDKKYTVLGTKRQQVTQYGNAVTPPAAEVIVAALVEAVTREEISRYEAVSAA
ncbi:DNA cytosine methyltransferase [Streptomyces synnematoformans]|uniref:DNA cytosine methyltransferase n=1 Tax=Streptomyces synnematoformans TaxID=415721 RepID=A0ABP5J4D0_9ACTN